MLSKKSQVGITTIMLLFLVSATLSEPNLDPLADNNLIPVHMKRKPFVRLGKSSFVRLGRTPEFAAKYPPETLTGYPPEMLIGYPAEIQTNYPELLDERMLRSSGFVRLGKSPSGGRSSFVRLGRPMDPWFMSRYANVQTDNRDESGHSEKRSASGGSGAGRVSSFVRLGKSAPGQHQQQIHNEKNVRLDKGGIYEESGNVEKRQPFTWMPHPVLDSSDKHSNKIGYGPKRYQLRL